MGVRTLLPSPAVGAALRARRLVDAADAADPLAAESLLNDRWRTRAAATADASGMVALQATLGEYVASWEEEGAPVHVRFRVERGPGAAVVAAVTPRT